MSEDVDPTGRDGAQAASPQDATQIYQRSGIGHSVGFGSRPAVVVVDLQNGFTDPRCVVGGALDDVVAASARLLEEARRAHLPICFTAVGFSIEERERSTWVRKMPGLGVLEEGSPWCDIDARVSPLAGEPVYLKRASSAFFGTPLLAFLVSHRVDTVIVVGCVTSGCVRATTVDGVSWGFRTIVPRECVGDRATGPHEASMFDIDAKYADVVPLGEVVEHIHGVPAAPMAALET